MWYGVCQLSSLFVLPTMLAALAARPDPDRPLDGLEVGHYELGRPAPGFARVQLKAASLNRHDVWTLRGYGAARELLPMVLGTDGAGVTEDGREVIVHAVIDDERAPSLLSERHPGTLAEWVAVPTANLVPKPTQLSFEEAACLPTAYLTAYNMLFGKGRVLPGEHVLIQGAGGGVATAAIILARAAGIEITVTSRDESRRERALELGAHHALPTGERLSQRVDAVLETVGAATYAHSLRSVRHGGRVIVAGGTTGFDPPAELQLMFLRDVAVIGTFMGTRDQLELLARFMATTGTKPLIDSSWPLAETHGALRRMIDGSAFGKLVIHPCQQ